MSYRKREIDKQSSHLLVISLKSATMPKFLGLQVADY